MDVRPTTAATVLCHNCGAPIDGSLGTLCGECVRLTHDISQGVPREAGLVFCRDCDRWLLPPATWMVAVPESRELLSICLKRLRGLSKVRVIDAGFIWTEPNSRRIRVKITVQDEVQTGVLLQQSFEVMYVVSTQQCPDCKKSYTHNTWKASVQVRQKVNHKRTFLSLEQLILKHGAHQDTLNIKEMHEGLDFYFAEVNKAIKFVDFLTSVAPVRIRKSQQLISQDVHTSTKSVKFSFAAELVPICREDLVALPIKLARQLGNIYPITLCHKIGTSIYLVDPSTLQTADVSSAIYWRAPFAALADTRQLVEFIVMDIDRTGPTKGKWALAEATVARAADLGVNNTTYFVRTHLGHLLQPGDSALGYMITGTNFNNAELDAVEESHAYGSTIPDVMLVKKHYPNRRKNRRRNWKLKRMNKEEGELLPKQNIQDRSQEEYEQFLRDVEDDDELRANMALYRAQQKKADPDAMSIAETEDGDDDAPKISVDELLEDMDELEIRD
ncbi:nonsense-mediated mRNA decay protein [Sodiomyces alkalinus F11]|uniref:60S ribosomal export protein NMD3 n=1 Tax=Sodiomyces alkalinus (strain CBS 110278 / VKM F-3762 / F11) TaxID=1314773 RepID=A0A3N2Q549_SODAK|nr:nonsense-mediated mRNA decay protein [Sodiomyces alkalinus F11]ROT41900.1 nonsense-mediated mRNA decay protein [Sodiomyces alkalinus F11]